MQVVVTYDGSPHNSNYHYLVNVGYHNGIINLRTYSQAATPLKINGVAVDEIAAMYMVREVEEQFPHEEFHYSIKKY